MHIKVENMYKKMPETLTRRFEQIDEAGNEGSLVLVLQHRSVNLNLELAAITEYATGQLRGTANLYAPLEGIKSPKEGIEALQTLSSLEQRLRWNGFDGRFGHYDDGVEFVYELRVDTLYTLQEILREFSFVPYNFALEFRATPKRPEHERAMSQKIDKYLNGEIGVFGTSYEEKNPTAKIVCWSPNTMQNALSVLRIGSLPLLDTISVEFWSEDEQTLIETEADLHKIHEDVVRLYGNFELTIERRARDGG